MKLQKMVSAPCCHFYYTNIFHTKPSVLLLTTQKYITHFHNSEMFHMVLFLSPLYAEIA